MTASARSLLKRRYRFIHQPHLAESDAEVVMTVEIRVFDTACDTELEFLEHLGKVFLLVIEWCVVVRDHARRLRRSIGLVPLGEIDELLLAGAGFSWGRVGVATFDFA
jgi:hypothetical protein